MADRYDPLRPLAGRSPRIEFATHEGIDRLLRPAPARRTARQVQGSVVAADVRIPRDRKRPFWQFSPDGSTIERAYDPEQEPLVLKID